MDKTVISFAVFGGIYIFLDSLIKELFWGVFFLIGSIVAIGAREEKHIKLSNIVCGLVIIFSIISLFYLKVVLPKQVEEKIRQETLTQIQQFNEKFTQYEGDNVRGSQVNSLLQQVAANNFQEDDVSRKIEVYFSDNCKYSSGNKVQNIEKTSTSAPKVSTALTYKVKCNISEKGQNKGLVKSIEVECNENNQNVNSKN